MLDLIQNAKYEQNIEAKEMANRFQRAYRHQGKSTESHKGECLQNQIILCLKWSVSEIGLWKTKSQKMKEGWIPGI